MAEAYCALQANWSSHYPNHNHFLGGLIHPFFTIFLKYLIVQKLYLIPAQKKFDPASWAPIFPRTLPVSLTATHPAAFFAAMLTGKTIFTRLFFKAFVGFLRVKYFPL